MFDGMHFWIGEGSRDDQSVNPHEGQSKTPNLRAGVNQLIGGAWRGLKQILKSHLSSVGTITVIDYLGLQ